MAEYQQRKAICKQEAGLPKLEEETADILKKIEAFRKERAKINVDNDGWER